MSDVLDPVIEIGKAGSDPVGQSLAARVSLAGPANRPLQFSRIIYQKKLPIRAGPPEYAAKAGFEHRTVAVKRNRESDHGQYLARKPGSGNRHISLAAGREDAYLPAMRPKVAVVIPAFHVSQKIVEVLSKVPWTAVSRVYVVDDACPEGSGRAAQSLGDPRVEVLFIDKNRGVGGATKAGFRKALAEGADIIVKCDGDGQMDPGLIPDLIAPVLNGTADYAKGNRFFEIRFLERMPMIRLIGNSVLSFLSKLSTGYWNIMDPTNGFVAIRPAVLARLPLDKIDDRYFFETDLLFRLNIARAVVVDVPMEAVYGDEISNLRISRILFDFALKHVRCFFKRIFYSYFLRDFSIASLELVFGTGLFVFGLGYGAYYWHYYSVLGALAPTGTVMVATLPVLLGFQLVLSFLNYDIRNVPTRVQGGFSGTRDQ